MGVDFETKCEQTALDYIKIHLQEGYLVTAYKDVGNYYWESVYKIRASLTTNRKTEQTERGSDDSQNDISASHSLRTVEDGDEQSLKGSERLLKGYLVKSPQKSRDNHEMATDEPTISKMEQVEDETRLTAKCLNCANGGSYKCSKCDGEMYFSKMYFREEPKDEPQTERSE